MMKNVIRSVSEDVPFNAAQLKTLFLVFKVRQSVIMFMH